MAVVLFAIFIAILLEASIITVPLVLLIILFASVVNPKNEMFTIAFFSGLILDIFGFGTIGFSSLYFTLMVLIIFLYRKKYEIESINFIAIFSFIASFIYLLIQGSSNIFFQSILASIIISSSYMYYKSVNKNSSRFVKKYG
jgi:rod shape-determining protein MreD